MRKYAPTKRLRCSDTNTRRSTASTQRRKPGTANPAMIVIAVRLRSTTCGNGGFSSSIFPEAPVNSAMPSQTRAIRRRVVVLAGGSGMVAPSEENVEVSERADRSHELAELVVCQSRIADDPTIVNALLRFGLGM